MKPLIGILLSVVTMSGAAEPPTATDAAMFHALQQWPAVRKFVDDNDKVLPPGVRSERRAYVNFLAGHSLAEAQALTVVLPGGHEAGKKGHTSLPAAALANLAFFRSAVEFRLFEIDGLRDAHLKAVAEALPSTVTAVMFEGVADDGSAVRHFAGKAQLRTFNLYFNQQVTDAALAPLAAIPNLESINLSGNPKLTGQGLAALRQLPQLRELKLNATGVSDETLEALAGLPLESLSLDRTGITTAGMRRLLDQGAGLPQLKTLSVKDCTKVDAATLAREGLDIVF